ncbi:MAG TPA: DNA-3-methyladenine glycosylase 2 family protein [Clostridiales bacterium]|jgi:N-glycosylase/DNA lyase|nr:DNA-3-methyladenine glycosylase 2 family protein [Clostridiales bacterium]
MKLSFTDNLTEITELEDFDPVKIFECGQCFRWIPDESGVYTGLFRKHAARVWREGEKVFITSDKETFEAVWRDYFDLDRDYAEIRRMFSIDDYMKKAAEFGKGIRILRQDRWEALCSFIISQCNNIPRIRKIIEALCQLHGEPVEFEGKTLFTFPAAEKLAPLSPEDLAPVRCGYRAPYIIDAARAVAEGRLDLDKLTAAGYETALNTLKTISGVGDKVANCIVLFGLQMLDAFPKDVWIKRALRGNYPKDFSPSVFGQYAGVAQQYMFYYARSGQN